MRPVLLLAALAACAPKTAPTPAAEAMTERSIPGPMGDATFSLPEVEEATLSNGLRVRLVPNHEVPLWELRLLVRTGSPDDPSGKEGLASITMAMADEGAGERNAAQLAATLKALGGSVGANAGTDRAVVYASGPKRTLEPILDVWADVLLRPTFPADEWTLLKARRQAAIREQLEDPTGIARRVGARLQWGDSYAGRLATEASLDAITTADMAAFHTARIVPQDALLLVGGDLSLDELVPLLEARLADWKPTGEPRGMTLPQHQTFDAATIYMVDKPGAAQSVLYAMLPVLKPGAEGWFPFYMGNTVLGGAFTARINMNLREDKGYTYGARCGIDQTPGDSTWICSSSVATGVTVPALSELKREIDEAVSTRPPTTDELAFFKSYRTHAFQTSYETPSELLGEVAESWTYGLPADWLERYVPSVSSVDAEAAGAALRDWIQPGRIAYLVVGDKASFGEELSALGLPVVELDRTAKPLEAP